MPEEFLLVPYQQRWVNDPSPRRIANKSRRIGFSFAESLRRTIRAVEHGIDQYLISATHRQSKGLLGMCRKHIHGLELATGSQIIQSDKAEQITLTNGATLKALPPNPRSIRGDGGDVLLDEFAFMPRSKEVWNAAKPIADITIGRPEGYEMAIVSTPFGDDPSNMFYAIWSEAAQRGFSPHQVDIFQAQEDGFPISDQKISEYRVEAGDEESFRQEYCCSFLSNSLRYISETLWDSCLIASVPPLPHNALRYGGLDIGRKNDPSAFVELIQSPEGILFQTKLAETKHGTRWSEQEAWADEFVPTLQMLGVDETGIGQQFAEQLSDRHPGRVSPIFFTSQMKETLATGLKLGLETGKLKHLDDPELRKDVLSIRKETTHHGTIRFTSPRKEGGHADRAWALALAAHVSGGFASSPLTDPQVYTSKPFDMSGFKFT